MSYVCDPLATKIQQALVKVGFRDHGVTEAEFYVVKHTKAPALLLEVGFFDNSTDNALFDAKFEAIVEGIANAVLEVVGKKNAKCPTCGQTI